MTARSDNPKVTVVIPTYNRARFLPSAVRSAMSQTLREIEIVIVDDGSTDESPSACRELAATDPRICVIRQENRGLACARNAGLAVARSDWVAFLDDDDLWVERALETLVERTNESTRIVVSLALGFVWSEPDVNAGMILANPTRYRVAPWPPKTPSNPIQLRELMMRPCFPPHAALSRAAELESLGRFDESRSAAEDYDMWLKLAARAPIGVVDERLALYRWHPGQMSAPLARQARETRLVLKRFLARDPLAWKTAGRAAMRRRLAYLAREEAYAELLDGNSKAARRAAADSVKLWPFGAKAWLYLLVSPVPRMYSGLRQLRRPCATDAT